jgi:hypothetical protein
MIVQANGSTFDLILCDCIYVPDICINLKDYKGSTYNVLVAWETGESTYEPLDLIASDDPITCAEYALKHNLLDEPGWKRFCHYTRKKHTLCRIVNQTKVSSYRQEPFWKLGVLVPRDHKQAMELDMKNNNKKWQDAEETEMHHLLEYHCKGVVIDVLACEQCYSLFEGESVFDYTPDKLFKSSNIWSAQSEIYFEKSSFHSNLLSERSKIPFEKSNFHLSNDDPNVEQHIVTHNLIAWNARTMKEDLVNFEKRFKHRLFLEDKDSASEDWKRSKFKEFVTSEYGE